MSRFLPHTAEIARSCHNAHAEMMMPEPVNHYPGGQRIRWIGQPLGEGRSSSGRSQARPRRDPRRLWIEDRQESRLYFLERTGVIAYRKHMCRRSFRPQVAHAAPERLFGMIK